MGEMFKFLRWVSSSEAPGWVNVIAGATVAVIAVSAFLGAIFLFAGLLATGYYTLAILLFPVSPVAVCYVAYRRAAK